MPDRLLDRVRQFGAVRSLARLCGKAGRFAYYRRSFALYRASGTHASWAREVHDLTSETLRAYGNTLPDELRGESCQFLDEGCTGVCWLAGERIGALGWIHWKGPYRFGRTLQLEPPTGFAIFKNLYVLPEFRGRGLASTINAARLRMAGESHALGFVDTANRAAARNLQRVGFAHTGDISESWRALAGWRYSVSIEREPELHPIEIEQVRPR